MGLSDRMRRRHAPSRAWTRSWRRISTADGGARRRRRCAKTNGAPPPATTLTTIYRRQSVVGVTFHAQSGNNRRFVRDPAGNIVAIYDTANNRWGYYLRDARESVIGIVDDTGTITNSYDYTPYGADTADTSKLMSNRFE